MFTQLEGKESHLLYFVLGTSISRRIYTLFQSLSQCFHLFSTQFRVGIYLNRKIFSLTSSKFFQLFRSINIRSPMSYMLFQVFRCILRVNNLICFSGINMRLCYEISFIVCSQELRSLIFSLNEHCVLERH